MLHEILLSLSGHPSPLLQSSAAGQQSTSPYHEHLAPPEAGLLSSLARLSSLHQKLLSHASTISSSHPSTICRATSAAIVSTHLARFQSKIVEVEANILTNDASLVGGYGIVPLSGVVAEFDGWTRRMEWFWLMAQFMQPDEEAGADKSRTSRPCTGAALMDKLRAESQTGYPDLEDAALDLLKVAGTAWLRQLSTWILYGRLPAFGGDDFFIQIDAETSTSAQAARDVFFVASDLLPKIVTPSTASAILFVGRSLNQIRARSGALSGSASSASKSPGMDLLPAHLNFLSSLPSPISSTSLSSAISAIRLSLSKHSLQQLLSLPKIVDVLTLLRDFFLLSRGEFAVALITEAEERTKARWRRIGNASREKVPSRLGSVLLKEGEVSAVLARTWAVLSSYQDDEDRVDDLVDLGRDLIHLSILNKPISKPAVPKTSATTPVDDYAMSEVAFDDLLLSTPVTLSLRIVPPLDLFLTSRDLQVYSSVHAYLLSIRRGHLRLTDLWKHSPLRRDHPSPIGPPMGSTRSGGAILPQKRARANSRARLMRDVWATSGAAVYLLTELGEYFQGEVVQSSWEALRVWLDGPPSPTSPAQPSSKAAIPTDPSDDEDIWSAASVIRLDAHCPSVRAPHDPEALVNAHRLFLSSLLSSLLLTDTAFTASLRSFLLLVDRLIDCIAALERAWSTLDLETDDGAVDAFTDARKEEKMAVVAVKDVTGKVKREVGSIVKRLRALDQDRAGGSWGRGVGLDGMGTADEFVPWKGEGVGRVVMKLDFGSLIETGEVENQG